MAKLRQKIKWRLVIYDVLLFTIISVLFLLVHPSSEHVFSWQEILIHTLAGLIPIILMRLLFMVYYQVWRYGGEGAFMRLVVADFAGYLVWFFIEQMPFMPKLRIILTISITAIDLVAALTMRFAYVFTYRRATEFKSSLISRQTANTLLRVIGGLDIDEDSSDIIPVSTNEIPPKSCTM